MTFLRYSVWTAWGNTTCSLISKTRCAIYTRSSRNFSRLLTRSTKLPIVHTKIHDQWRASLHHILSGLSRSILRNHLGEPFPVSCKRRQITSDNLIQSVQEMIENVHLETYSLYQDTFIQSPREKYKLLGSIETVPCVKRKDDWEIRF